MLELNMEAAMCDIEETFLVWLDRVLAELPPTGLSIQITVKDIEEWKKVKAGFLEAVKNKDVN